MFLNTPSAPKFINNFGLTALSGGAQVGATQLNLDTVSTFATVGLAGDSAILPSATGSGRVCVVVNNGANVMHVFPAVGEQIVGAGGINAFVSPGVGRTDWFIDIAPQTWSNPLV
jgi:hypothetical protein